MPANRQESKYAGTASLMDEALLLLLEKKDFDRITVKELCQKAGVNRSTFYLHYETLNDLLEETVERINERFKQSLAAIEAGDPSREVLTSEKYLRPYLQFIKDNMRAYRVIHLQDHLFHSQKTFEGFYQSIFSPRSRISASRRRRKSTSLPSTRRVRSQSSASGWKTAAGTISTGSSVSLHGIRWQWDGTDNDREKAVCKPLEDGL